MLHDVCRHEWQSKGQTVVNNTKNVAAISQVIRENVSANPITAIRALQIGCRREEKNDWGTLVPRINVENIIKLGINVLCTLTL
jgi:hypothetical protein